MPFATASATKLNWRQAVAQHPLISDWFPGQTTGAGTTTTVVDSGLSGWGDNEFQEWFVLAGANAGAPGEYRIVDIFTGSTLTLRTANSIAIGNAHTYYLHRYRPDWYTLAYNLARDKLYSLVYRAVTGHLSQPSNTPTLQRVWGFPRNMLRAFRVYESGQLLLNDEFDRANSSGSVGGNWTVTSGTGWGVTSERLVYTLDQDGNLLTLTNKVKDGLVQAIVQGYINGVTYHMFALVFHMREDYTGALDTANYLYVLAANGLVDLRKNDGGNTVSLASSSQTIANATDYRLRVLLSGPTIRVWLDDVEVITYTLTGLNLKYLDYPRVGIRISRAAGPLANAQLDSFSLYEKAVELDRNDWDQDSLSQVITFDHAPSTARLISVDGGGLLSALADDTAGSAGAGTIASDGTATIEMQTTDPAWSGLLVPMGVAELLRIALANARTDTQRQYYAQLAAQADAMVKVAMETHAMPWPRVTVRYPYP